MELSDHLSKGIDHIVKTALRTAIKNPQELLFLGRFQDATQKAQHRRDSARKRGLTVPPFLIASITRQCNLRCKGCYAASLQCASETLLPPERWDALFEEAASLGVSFILLAGGEPFLRPEIIQIASKHRDILFPVFTNGTYIDHPWTEFLNKNRNIVPILSIEGDQSQTDFRRGKGVYDLVCSSMEGMSRKSILFGASVTVTSANLEEVTRDDFIRFLTGSGAAACIFVEYVPTDPSTASLAIRDEQRISLLQRLDQIRSQHPMVVLAFPGDEKELGGCLAAGRGFFHINAAGGAEPCPFSPFSDINLMDHTLEEALSSPLFLRLQQSEILQTDHQGGCVLFTQQDAVQRMASCPQNS